MSLASVTSSDMRRFQTSGLKTSTQIYRGTAATKLSNVKLATRSLLEKGTREDAPTGTTPRKRVWEYPDQWKLTKPRDEVVREWRNRRGNSTALPDAVQAHLSPTKDEDREPEMPAMEISPPDLELAMDVDIKMEDEEPALARSTPSSGTSSSCSSSALQVHKSTGANGFGKVTKVPGFGPYNALRERSTNLLPPKGSRRPR
jgi:kinesin family protein 11